jgi:hypothetical protein
VAEARGVIVAVGVSVGAGKISVMAGKGASVVVGVTEGVAAGVEDPEGVPGVLVGEGEPVLLVDVEDNCINPSASARCAAARIKTQTKAMDRKALTISNALSFVLNKRGFCTSQFYQVIHSPG